MVTYQITIDGMHCENCVEKIQSALNATRSVASCRVSLPKGQAVVTFENGQPNLGTVVEAIQEKGFTVSGYAAVAS